MPSDRKYWGWIIPKHGVNFTNFELQIPSKGIVRYYQTAQEAVDAADVEVGDHIQLDDFGPLGFRVYTKI